MFFSDYISYEIGAPIGWHYTLDDILLFRGHREWRMENQASYPKKQKLHVIRKTSSIRYFLIEFVRANNTNHGEDGFANKGSWPKPLHSRQRDPAPTFCNTTFHRAYLRSTQEAM